MHFIKSLSGINWHYDIKGSGEAVVFLHGWGVNMRIWRQQFKQFSKTHAAISIDLPGHGKTEWKKICLDEMAEDIKQILMDLDVKKFNIVGSSFGGLIAIRVAELMPEHVKRLVFVGSQPKFAQSHDYPFGLEVQRIRRLATQLKEDYKAMINIFFRSLFTKEERSTRRFKWIQKFRKEEALPNMDAVLGLLDVLEKEDLRENLKNMKLPIQFIYGEEDYICPKEVFEGLKEDVPHARFDPMKKTGHFPFLIHPDQFNLVLEDFLTS